MDRELTSSRGSGIPYRRRSGQSHRPGSSILRLRDSVFLLGLLCLPSAGGAQELLDRILDFTEAASGFALLETPYQSRMKSGDKAVVTVPLVLGADYMVVGFCEDGCTNLDLVLFDPHGREIQADRLPDSEPILMYTAESTGRFTVQVETPACSTESCHVMVGVLASASESGLIPGEDMAGRLVIFGSELEVSGFTQVREPWRGALATDRLNSIPLRLESGIEYRIAGVCDNDCYDMDMALLDSAGQHLTSDQLPDEFPIVAYIPDVSGEYRLEVLMVACGVEPCGYRVAAYSRVDTAVAEVSSVIAPSGHQETHQGKLAPGDEVLNSGAYLDVFQVEVQAGQRLIADLQSSEFDTFLRVLPPEGEGEENDDYGQQLGHSHIDMEAKITGTYTVHVTSYEPKATGIYSLQIAVAG